MLVTLSVTSRFARRKIVDEKRTIHFEVAVRVRLKLETLILILKPQSAVFLGGLLLQG